MNDKRRELGWDKHPQPESRLARLVSWPVETAAAHMSWLDRTFTDHDPAKRRAMWRSVTIRAVLVVGAYSSFVLGWGEDNLLVLLARGGIIGLAMMAVVGYPLWRAQMYRYGWWYGRQAMRKSFREAQERGMTVHDWYHRELERDLRDF